MLRDLRLNHNAPEIYPIPNCPIIPRAPRIQIPVIMTEYNETPLHADFNPGTVAGQKIFLEKTRGLPGDKRLNLTASNAIKIMEPYSSRKQTWERSSPQSIPLGQVRIFPMFASLSCRASMILIAFDTVKSRRLSSGSPLVFSRKIFCLAAVPGLKFARSGFSLYSVMITGI